jgi:hypothetical protein
MCRPLLSAIALLLLASCANPTAETEDWRRAGTAPEDAGADLQACTISARHQVDREHANEGMAGDTTNQDSLITNMNAYDQDKRVDALTRQCMLLHGYQPLAPGAS